MLSLNLTHYNLCSIFRVIRIIEVTLETCNFISLLPPLTSAVDDFQVLKHCLASVLEWTRATKLKLNLDKTENLRGVVTRLDGTALPFRDQVCNLGVLLDLALSWESQIVAVSSISL